MSNIFFIIKTIFSFDIFNFDIEHSIHWWKFEFEKRQYDLLNVIFRTNWLLKNFEYWLSKKNNYLHDEINRKTCNLRNIRTHWRKTKKQLKIMIYNVDFSNFFFIFNAIDMQWIDLYRHFFANWKNEYDNVNKFVRIKIVTRFLQQYFYIVVEYLIIRFRHFFNEIFKKKFKIIDHWYRYEWQNKNNNHIHNFFK